jgi:hypothetical protein
MVAPLVTAALSLAVAVFELLDDLRGRLWAVHGGHIQDLRWQEQGAAADFLPDRDPSRADQLF